MLYLAFTTNHGTKSQTINETNQEVKYRIARINSSWPGYIWPNPLPPYKHHSIDDKNTQLGKLICFTISLHLCSVTSPDLMAVLKNDARALFLAAIVLMAMALLSPCHAQGKIYINAYTYLCVYFWFSLHMYMYISRRIGHGAARAGPHT